MDDYLVNDLSRIAIVCFDALDECLVEDVSGSPERAVIDILEVAWALLASGKSVDWVSDRCVQAIRNIER